MIANGDCTDGWIFYNGTGWDYDPTMMIDCTRTRTEVVHQGKGLQRALRFMATF